MRSFTHIARLLIAVMLAVSSMAGLAAPCSQAAANVLRADAGPAHHDPTHHRDHQSDAHVPAAHADADPAPLHDHETLQGCFVHCLSATIPASLTRHDEGAMPAERRPVIPPEISGLRPAPLERPPNPRAA